MPHYTVCLLTYDLLDKVQSFAYLYGCSGTTLMTTASGQDIIWLETN
jgi:hypothetical protein